VPILNLRPYSKMNNKLSTGRVRLTIIMVNQLMNINLTLAI